MKLGRKLSVNTKAGVTQPAAGLAVAACGAAVRPPRQSSPRWDGRAARCGETGTQSATAGNPLPLGRGGCQILVRSQQHAIAIADRLEEMGIDTPQKLKNIRSHFGSKCLGEVNYIRFYADFVTYNQGSKSMFLTWCKDHKQISLDDLFEIKPAGSIRIANYTAIFNNGTVTFGCQSFTRGQIRKILDLFN